MKRYNRFAQFAWGFSILVFFVVLFLAYYYWPQVVDVKLNKEVYHVSDIYIPKSDLFYYILGFFAVTNLIFSLLSNTLFNLPKALLKVPNADFWLKDIESIRAVRYILRTWATSFNTLLNFLITGFTGTLLIVNFQDQFQGSKNFDWFLPLSFILILLFIIYLITRFNRKKFSVDDSNY